MSDSKTGCKKKCKKSKKHKKKCCCPPPPIPVPIPVAKTTKILTVADATVYQLPLDTRYTLSFDTPVLYENTSTVANTGAGIFTITEAGVYQLNWKHTWATAGTTIPGQRTTGLYWNTLTVPGDRMGEQSTDLPQSGRVQSGSGARLCRVGDYVYMAASAFAAPGSVIESNSRILTIVQLP